MALRPSKPRAPAGVLLGPWLGMLGVLGVLAGLFFGAVAFGAAAGATARRPAIGLGATSGDRDGRDRGGEVVFREPVSRGEALPASGGAPVPVASEPSARRPGLARVRRPAVAPRDVRPSFACEPFNVLPLPWGATAIAHTLYPEATSALAGASPPFSHLQAVRRQPQARDVHAPRGPPPALRATSGDRRRA